MKEKISEIVIDVSTEKLRSLQEVMGDFNHLKNCSRLGDLIKVTKKYVVYIYGKSVFDYVPSPVIYKDYIECTECRVSQCYAE